MDNLLRFSDYDVFAYLVSGFAALAMIDMLAGTDYIVHAEWTAASGALAFVAAYILGQILASPAAWVMEAGLARELLGSPSKLLMTQKRPSGLKGILARTVLRNYFQPLDPSTIAAVSRLTSATGDALFWRAYADARQDPIASQRMEGFLRLYGFCRNIGFIAFLTFVSFAALAIGKSLQPGQPQAIESYLALSAISALVAVGITLRYLKFYRLYSLEALIVLARQGMREEKS